MLLKERGKPGSVHSRAAIAGTSAKAVHVPARPTLLSTMQMISTQQVRVISRTALLRCTLHRIETPVYRRNAPPGIESMSFEPALPMLIPARSRAILNPANQDTARHSTLGSEMRIRVLLASTLVGLVATACHRTAMSSDEHMAHMSGGDMAAPSGSASSAGNAALPPSNNAAKARLESSPRHGEWVKLAWAPGSADSLEAWVVYPSTSNAKTPVVVVVHEIFGLSTWVRGVADQVAADGFIAVAPDLVSRVRGGPSTQELSGDSARKLIAGVSTTERNQGIIAAARYAMSQPSAAPRYAVIGYCWGGSTVWAHAVNGGTNGFVGGVATAVGYLTLSPDLAVFAPAVTKGRPITSPLGSAEDEYDSFAKLGNNE